jgi:hypothetical protein
VRGKKFTLAVFLDPLNFTPQMVNTLHTGEKDKIKRNVVVEVQLVIFTTLSQTQCLSKNTKYEDCKIIT